MISIDVNRCHECGLCAKVCTEGCIEGEKGQKARVQTESGCLDCHHCFAVCPKGAIATETERPKPHRRSPIDADQVEALLTTKRSCRFFTDEPVARDDLERLLNVARQAPSAKNSEERCFIVVTDKEKLSALRRDLVKNNRKILRLLRLITTWPFRLLLPDDSVAAIRRMIPSVRKSIELSEAGTDSIFHDAPAVVFIGGIGMDAMGKDNALAAQHYLMVQAQAMGLGSCIMGYAQAAPKIVERHLDVPRYYSVMAAVALGHPAVRFARPAPRKAPVVQWVEGSTQDNAIGRAA